MATGGKRVGSFRIVYENFRSCKFPFPFCMPVSSDADCCVAFPFLLRGEGASGAPQFNYPSNAAPTEESERACSAAVLPQRRAKT